MLLWWTPEEVYWSECYIDDEVRHWTWSWRVDTIIISPNPPNYSHSIHLHTFFRCSNIYEVRIWPRTCTIDSTNPKSIVSERHQSICSEGSPRNSASPWWAKCCIISNNPPITLYAGISFQFTVILLELTVGGIEITGGPLGATKENNSYHSSIQWLLYSNYPYEDTPCVRNIPCSLWW